MPQPEGEGGHRQVTYQSEYVTFHFAAEEREMIGSRYTGMEQHEEEHKAFKTRIA
jgi:hemerythrin